ncbi:putative E3 ubiquitin-protein ligase LIN-1 [Cornus florida]|uniref:putative E3 ubiquitin-protein ligase LIN-1 n=1 Tax=Cornus florida TaxID=4283 RepID=UPI00289665AB|nr:putative E3 ubiquitin-protein ligase LIN-1 [Cornus florida]
MFSLHDLLADEGFEFRKGQKKQVRFRDRVAPQDESIALPIYICHDRNSFNLSKHKADKSVARSGSSVFSSKRGDSSSRRSKSMSTAESGPSKNEPAIDEVAIRAVISILSGYVGRYLKDETFRETIKGKCNSCLERKNKDSDNGIFANMELGIESIERLVGSPGTKKELNMKSMRNSIRLLSIVASLNSKKSKNGSTCGTPNSHLSACAQLYLSIVYKIEKNDRISARHLLQVFCDSPSLARTHLLPELWEHFFLPHLLHLKIWYTKELEFLSNSDYGDKEKKMKALSKVYNDQIDMGTIKFALYYKEWLRVGGQSPTLPSLPLPSRPFNIPSRRRSLDSYTSHSSVNKSLFQAVFGQTIERRSMDLDDRNGALINTWGLEEEEKEYLDEEDIKGHGSVENRTRTRRRSSSLSQRKSQAELRPEMQKSDYLRFLTCQSEPTESLVHRGHMSTIVSIRNTENTRLSSTDLSGAIATICSSEILSDCEVATRVITKAWLVSHGDPAVEKTLSKAPVIEGMMEVLLASNDNEILEFAVSMLAEFVSRNEANRHIILNSDPQLDIFMKLLRSSSLFLKAAVLLYLVKPKAKQMISNDWIPLVLRVLEFGDQLQTLFAVQCSPQVAAYYFLDQLLTGFDEDRNLENARQVVSIGGLSLLEKRMEIGDVSEKNNAALVISCCIRADGSCRHYVANNLNKGSILELLVLGKHRNCHWYAFTLLTELICLNRNRATKFLNELICGWGNLNTMHILLAYLQKARLEERPIVAAILLQLDLLGDPLKCSVYREEVVEAIITGLDCQVCNEKVQEQSAKALMILGGRFSYTGEAAAEKWLLKEAGFFDDSSGDSFHGKKIFVDEIMQSNEEDNATENWQRKAAIVLVTSGSKRFLAALSDSISNGIPCLARASLVTVSWISSFLHSVGDENLQSMACSIFVPQLIESLNYDKALEERVLASFSLLSLIKSSDCVSKFSKSDKELLSRLRDLSQVTWTASELISVITSSLRHHYTELDKTPTYLGEIKSHH